MFPSAKKRKGLSPGRPPRKEKAAKSPKRTASGQRESKDKAGKEWKKSRDGEKPFRKKMKMGGKTFGAKTHGDRENKFGGKKRFDGKKKDKSFKSKGLKAKAGFKKKGTGAKQGFKHRKGKG